MEDIEYLSDSDSEDVHIEQVDINLDVNAGLPLDINSLQKDFNIGNIHGFTVKAREVQVMVEQARLSLCKAFGFDGVYYIPSASYMFDVLRPMQPYPFPNQHPAVNWTSSNKYICLINLLTSDKGLIQTDQIQQASKFKYIVIDATQAIGRIPLPTQEQVDCLFISCHKYQGCQGLVFMSNEFFKECIFQQKPKIDYNDINLNFLSWPQVHFNTMNFMTDYYLTMKLIKQTYPQTKFTYDRLHQILQDKVEIKEPEGLHANCCILFKPNACVRSFQNKLSQQGIIIGFQTACSSNQNGLLRLSWRNNLTQEQLNYFEVVFNNALTLKGGAENLQGNNNLKKINKGQFWLKGHWVDNHNDKNLNAKIPIKYSIIFQDFILNSNVLLGVKIPEYPSKRRIAKNLYINPQLENIQPEAYLTIDMFKKNNLPEIVSQNYEGRIMNKRMYDFIIKNGLDINHEYQQRGSGIPEILLQIKVPFEELLVSACNSYYNFKDTITRDSQCKIYREGKDEQSEEQPEKKVEEVNVKELAKKILTQPQKKVKGGDKQIYRYKDTYTDTKILYVIRPCYKMTEIKKALQLAEDMIKNKMSFILILPDKFNYNILQKLEQIRQMYCVFNTFQSFWYYDQYLKIYTYKFTIE